MRLTKFTDLGLRVLMYSSQNEKRSKPITINEIASQLAVPRNHLIKVVAFLNKTSWLQTTRGPNGGLRLAADPDTLRLGQVIKVLERCDELVDCAESPCPLQGLCGLKSALDHGLEAFYQHMDSYSLGDVMRNQTANTIIHIQQDYLDKNAIH